MSENLKIPITRQIKYRMWWSKKKSNCYDYELKNEPIAAVSGETILRIKSHLSFICDTLTIASVYRELRSDQGLDLARRVSCTVFLKLKT